MIGPLARLRIRLLLRQRMFWGAALLAVLAVVLSYLLGQISFVKPEKVFWDFALGATFLIQIFLALFLGSFLVSEEREKRTLHWVLSMKVSRGAWLAGNFVGLAAALGLVAGACGLLVGIFGSFFPDRPDLALVLQCQVLTALEACVVLTMSLFFALWMRPLLAFNFSAILVLFLHSQDSLRHILVDPVSGRFVENRGLSLLLYLARLFPPLQWFDLRDLVGYQSALAGAPFLGVLATGLLWLILFGFLSKITFERLDL